MLDVVQVLWHSAAHILGAAVQEHFGNRAMLCDGPPLKEDSSGGGGYFYEMFLTDDARVTDADYDALVKAAKKLMKAKSRFDKLAVSKAFAKRVFATNPFKCALIDSIPEGDAITLYRCGEFVDLCRGPHVPHTGYIKVRSSHAVAAGCCPARSIVSLHGSRACDHPCPGAAVPAIAVTWLVAFLCDHGLRQPV